MLRIDIVIPCHPKDIPILGPCIDSVRRFVPDAGRIYVVSRDRIDAGDTWIPEDAYDFSREDCERLLPTADGCARWYLQQLLKLLPDLTFNFSLVKKLGNLTKPGLPATLHRLLGYNHRIWHISTTS